ncbi:ATP-binding cassette domain-containing protein [Lysobacter sp. H23M47]|uniref:ABC transporter ATP-binding protein n=1 Tax=Lysobacter sp. H23M47 TaxID=2781024 RepID=UPI00187E8441|nr:ATP-binding cassette domain-containing protein [Lysobacter sp. H23M47]QOW24170.1 ABC transporter ATP-binding protein [Lysobacter sp. H23M47]
MSVFIRADRLTLDVPIFLQRERAANGWGGMFMGAAMDTPKRSLVRLLDDLSFEIREGDRLAILGRNGAGKSTLLRVLNRVYQPTSGQLTVQGTCQALLNMSLGFNGEATVRENIYLRGVAMGLKAAFLRPQVESILDFAGLEHKINHRLRTLSSGQKMRLGFAISTSVQHDIMLMDEWVGAGDSDFMAKAKERMQSRVGGSKIVVLASHSVGLLRDMCNKGIVLEGGKLAYAGDITSSLKCYHEMMAELRANKTISLQAQVPVGAQVYGVIEEIRCGGREGVFLIKGWMVDTEGALPSGIALEVHGHRYVAQTLVRIKRPDVMNHLGLSNGDCGFHAEISVPGVLQLSGLGSELRILGGLSADHADAPLRLGAAVTAALNS